MKAIMVSLALASPLAGCTPAFAGDTFSLGAGKMLNNTSTKVPGWVASVEYAHTRMLWDVSIRARYMKAERSHLSEWGNSTFVSLAAAKDFGQWAGSVGPVVYMNYDSTVEWLGKLYPHGPSSASRNCHMCGYMSAVTYHFKDSRFSAELQYYAVQKASPTYQGAIVMLKYDIYRREP